MADSIQYNIKVTTTKLGKPARCTAKAMDKRKKAHAKKGGAEKNNKIVVAPTKKNSTLLGTTLSLAIPATAVVETAVKKINETKSKVIVTSVTAKMPVTFEMLINSIIDCETPESKICYNEVLKHEKEHVDKWRKTISGFNAKVPESVTKAAEPIEFKTGSLKPKAIAALELKKRKQVSAAVLAAFKAMVELAQKNSDAIHTEKRYAKEAKICEIHMGMNVSGSGNP